MDVVESTNAGPVIRVRARPGSSRDAVEGVLGDRLVVAVRAVREKGKANAAVMEALALWLGVPKRAIDLVSGGSARDKRFLVHGVTDGQLRARVERALSRS